MLFLHSAKANKSGTAVFNLPILTLKGLRGSFMCIYKNKVCIYVRMFVYVCVYQKQVKNKSWQKRETKVIIKKQIPRPWIVLKDLSQICFTASHPLQQGEKHSKLQQYPLRKIVFLVLRPGTFFFWVLIRATPLCWWIFY